ncbi:hypothetical protein H4W80_005006 [Nonomuraea angiospora]|uniref:Uncharacterized protein n=1 Tax=Nonomuraea angiospora TaxID=46172 RepID=A0ABR9M1J2_9ACTN|nr:hypothetical protein [Nonomuraea angiospora]
MLAPFSRPDVASVAALEKSALSDDESADRLDE